MRGHDAACRLAAGWLLAAGILTSVPDVAAAQVGVRPADGLQAPLEPLQPGSNARTPEAPPELETPPDARRLPTTGAAPLRIRASGFEVLGVTAFDRDVLSARLRPFVDRTLTTLDLLAAVEALRSLYHEAGYTTTLVELPDQDLDDEIVRLRVREGRVDRVDVESARFHLPAYLRFRLASAIRAPLDVPKLKRRLEVLQREAGIYRVAATLVEVAPATHRLRLEVEEASPVWLRARTSNHRSPGIGSFGGRLTGGHRSVFGFGGELAVGGQWSKGLRDLSIDWNTPISGPGTRLLFAYRNGRADIVEEPFEDEEIEGRFESVMIGVRHPVALPGRFSGSAELRGEWRRSASSILGRLTCFEADLRDCTPSATVLRLRGELAWRSNRRVVAGRSTLSLGVDVLGATDERDAGDRDGEFVAGLLQLQWAERLPEIGPLPFLDGHQLLVRADLQLSSDPLLAFEQIAVGGAQTVRGYRQNQLVRDNGAIVSVEWWLPIWRTRFDRPILSLAPFVDYGSAWDRRRGRSPDETIVSVGASLELAPIEALRTRLSYAHRFRDNLPRGDRLQRGGFYFEVVWDVF